MGKNSDGFPLIGLNLSARFKSACFWVTGGSPCWPRRLRRDEKAKTTRYPVAGDRANQHFSPTIVREGDGLRLIFSLRFKAVSAHDANHEAGQLVVHPSLTLRVTYFR